MRKVYRTLIQTRLCRIFIVGILSVWPATAAFAQDTAARSSLELFAEVTDLTEAKKTLAEILAEAKEKVSTENRDTLGHADTVLGQIHSVVNRRPLIQDDCVDRSLRYLAVAEELKLPIRIFAAGNHVFVSFKGSYFDLGWEPLEGRWRNHEDYQRKYHIEQKTIDDGVFLVPLDRDGVQSVVCTTVAEMLIEKEQREQALTALDKAVKLNSKNVLAVASRGMLQLELGRNDEAVSDLERAVELYPAHDTALFRLAMERNRRGDYRGSVSALAQILQYYPHSDPVVKQTRDFIADKAALNPALAHFAGVKEGGEHVLYVFPLSGRLFDVTRDGDRTSARPNWDKIAGLPDEPSVFIIHNHRLDRETYFQLVPLDETARARVNALDLATFERRLFIEVPSRTTTVYGRGGDFDLALMAEERLFAKSSSTTPRHFIACFRKSSAPQIVEYGLTAAGRKDFRERLVGQAESIQRLEQARRDEAEDSPQLKAAQEACSVAIKHAERFVLEMCAAYDDAWETHRRGVLLPHSEGEGKEPNLDELIKLVDEKSGGKLFLKNYGAFAE